MRVPSADDKAGLMKDWTIRGKVIASFSLILALMVVMVAVAYSRLVRIDQETTALRTDSVAGVYHAASLRDAWTKNFLVTEELLLQEDAAVKRATEARLIANRADLTKAIADYETTIFQVEDR